MEKQERIVALAERLQGKYGDVYWAKSSDKTAWQAVAELAIDDLEVLSSQTYKPNLSPTESELANNLGLTIWKHTVLNPAVANFREQSYHDLLDPKP